MKKLITCVLIICICSSIMGCEKQQTPKIIEIAYNSLTDKYKSDVINKDNPKVEDTEYYYKVTFNAKSDAILGPIVVTVDKKSLRTSTSLRD